jgi:hypothetical protein
MLRVLTAISLLTTPTVYADDYEIAEEETGEFAFDMQVDQNGSLYQSKFRLNWGDKESSLKTIEIINTETNEIYQKIDVSNSVSIPYQEVFYNGEPREGFKDKIFDLVDYNFDNYGDIRLIKTWPYTLDTKGYLVYIYHLPDNEFRLNSPISELPNPIPDPKTYRIETRVLGGWAGGEFTRRFYSIDKKGEITLQSKWEQKIKDPLRMSFIRDVRIRLDGSLQRICKLLVVGEGVAKVIWGNKKRCHKYRKHPEREK